MLSQTMKELRKLRGALRVVAIGIIVSPNMKDYFLKQWAKIKIICLSNNCSDIQVGKVLSFIILTTMIYGTLFSVIYYNWTVISNIDPSAKIMN